MSEVFDFGGREVEAIDLSQALSNTTSEFEPLRHQIDYIDHVASRAYVEERWGLEPEAWRDGLVWANELVSLATHSGTHVDAPYHYHPTSEGRPARTIEEVPLRWVMGDGVVLNVAHCDRVEGIREADVRAELERIEYELKPYDIVLLRTDVSRRFGEPGYDQLHPGLRRDACAWLVERGVKLIGIDAWGIDRPFDLMAEDAHRGDVEQLWESHKYGADREYSQIEKLCNLDRIPRPHGFQVIALPVSIERASAGWARVVALCPREPEA
jgi:kynurenine formamidase